MPVDPITISYFVKMAWGLSSGFLFKFKRRTQSKQQSTATNLVGEGSVDYFINTKIEDEEGKTVIDDAQLAAERFTPQYLYAINCCRQHAINDPSSITTK